MKLKILLLVLVILMLIANIKTFSLHTGEATKKSKNEVVIGLSLDTLKEARWQKDRDMFVEQAEKLGAKVLVQSANSDDTAQIKDIQSLITNGVKCLVIVPHDGAAMAKGVEMANKAGIPVISYDRLITGADITYYLSFDNIKVGEKQAQFLVDAIGGKGKIVRMYGAPTDNNAKMFKQGQDNVLQPLIDKGDIEVVHEDWATDWDPSNAKKIMNAALTKTKDFAGVLCSNDGTAGGAIQALKEAGLEGKVVVTGQDADEVACQRIVNGTQSMTVYKPISKLARKAAILAVKLATHKPVSATGIINNGFKDVPTIYLPVVTVTKDNMDTTVIKDNFHTKEAIYGK